MYIQAPFSFYRAEVNVADLLAAFPVAKLNKLEELISNPRWVIPVMPKAELEMLLEAAIALAKHGVDSQVRQ